jgi:CSLREA domain-containing protein
MRGHAFYTRLGRVALTASLLACMLPNGPAAYAAPTIIVTTMADEITNDGNCSLREAIRAANTNAAVDACEAGSATEQDTVVVPPGTYQLSIDGRNEDASLTGDLDITGNITINGTGAAITTVAGGGDRVIHVLLGATVRITGLTITGGSLPFGEGAGIRNEGALDLVNVAVAGNRVSLPIPPEPCPFPDCPVIPTGGGAGIANFGVLRVVASTISNNRLEPMSDPEAGFGGGIMNLGQATLINSTVTDNTAFDGAGIGGGTTVLESSTVALNISDSPVAGISRSSLTMRNSIVARNQPLTSGIGNFSDCETAVSEGFNLVSACTLTGDQTGNLIGVDPKLGPLSNNGGPTPTLALLAGSPAIDAANPVPPGSTALACPPTDQRGVSRPQDGNLDGQPVCDIGAYELRTGAGTPPPNAVPPSRSAP